MVVVLVRVPDLPFQAEIWIGAAIEQRPCELKIIGALRGVIKRIRVFAFRRPPGIEHGVQRRGTVALCEVWIGAPIDEVHGHVEAAVDGGNHQGGGRISRIDLVDVDAALHKRLDGVEMALPGGKHQRRQASLCADALDVAWRLRFGVRRFRLCLRRTSFCCGAAVLDGMGVAARQTRIVFGQPGPIEDARGRAPVGAAIEQSDDGCGPPFRCREHQRGFGPARLGGVRLGAGVEQRGHRVGISRCGRQHERRRAELVARVRIGAVFHQRPDGGGLAVLRRQLKRRRANQHRRRLEVRSCRNQHRGNRRIALGGGRMERGQPVSSSTVDVLTGFQELAHGGCVVALHRGQDGRLAAGGGVQRGEPQASEQTGHQATTPSARHGHSPC